MLGSDCASLIARARGCVCVADEGGDIEDGLLEAANRGVRLPDEIEHFGGPVIDYANGFRCLAYACALLP